MHRDIRMENVMLQSHNDVNDIKLIDFNYSCHWTHYMFGQQKDVLKINQFKGSYNYSAPEVLACFPSKKAHKGNYSARDENYYNELADLWSVGVIAYTLLARRHPFEDNFDQNKSQIDPRRIEQMNQDIRKQVRNFPSECEKYIKNRTKEYLPSIFKCE